MTPNIIELRDATGLSQDSFALLCNFSRTTLTNIENDKALPSLTILNKISNFTTIGLEKLAKREYIPPINLRKKLLKKYSNDPSKYVVLNTTPSVLYWILTTSQLYIEFGDRLKLDRGF